MNPMPAWNRNPAARRMMAAVFSAVLLGLAPSAEAVKKQPPLRVAVTFDSAAPRLNRNETLRVVLFTPQAYTNLKVSVTLPPPMALVSGRPSWQGPLAAGAERHLPLTVQLRQPGRYSVQVDVQFDPGESAFTALRTFLNIIAENDTVAAAMDPFELMDLDRARTPAEVNRVLNLEGVATPAAPLPAEPQAPPGALGPESLPPPESSVAPGGTPEGTVTLTVFGQFAYLDANGRAHPIRLAKVKVFDVDPGGVEVLMGEGSTGVDGRYSIRARGGDPDSGPDVRVRVYTAIKNDWIATLGANRVSTYSMATPTYMNRAAGALQINLTTGRPVRGSAADNSAARAFSVLDAILQIGVESYALRNNRLPPRVFVTYPDTGTAYRRSETRIRVGRQDALDWDVIWHEYGHFMADKGAASRFDTSPGGPHFGGSTIAANGKGPGVRLAWSEGFATWFAIRTQLEPTQRLLALPNLPNPPFRDRRYQDTEDSTINDDLETYGNGPINGGSQGYASEDSICAMLWDLTDGEQDTSSDSTAKDTVNLTPKQIWDIINSGPWDNVSKFYNRLYAVANRNVQSLLWYTQTFAMNNIAPELIQPRNVIVSSAISPTFTWRANGDPGAAFALNRFTLLIGKGNFAAIVGRKENIQPTQYKFTDAEWAAITAQSDNTGIFQWLVAGYNSAAPRLPAAAEMQFVSNTQQFKIRAYHIRLTWNNLGADVDLHFKNPNGDDCFYNRRNPDWGVPGDVQDNPSLDRDCIQQCTEENTTIDLLRQAGTYRIEVHYYSDHGRGASTARVEVFKYGRRVGVNTSVLRRTGDWWTPFTITHVGAEAEQLLENPEEPISGVVLEPKVDFGEQRLDEAAPVLAPEI